MRCCFYEIEPWETEYLRDRLRGVIDGNFLALHEETLDEGFMKEVEDAEILSVFIYSRVTAEMMAAMPRLKLIVTRSTGYDHLDVTAAAARGIAVANVPTYGENTVAEHTFALLLALSRRIYPSITRTKQFDFSSEGLRGFDVKGKTLGIVGLGHIGRHVARQAAGFEMKVVGFDPKMTPGDAEKIGAAPVSFDQLLMQSDIITLHCPYTRATHHLVDQDAFAKMKHGVFIINTARGGLIDTQALVSALETKKVAGAGLDVLEEECEVKEERQLASKHWNDPQCDLRTMLANHVLADRDDVILTPHNAWNSREAIERILTTTAENIESYIKGKPSNLVG